MKVCIISSCGGHLTEVRSLIVCYQHFEHFYVINDPIDLPDDMLNKTYFIAHSERDLKFFLNFYEAIKILLIEKPDVLLSTGAGLVVPFAIICFFTKIKIIFIETMACVERPSMTGRIMYYLSDYFYYQWPQLSKYYSKGKYGGLLF